MPATPRELRDLLWSSLAAILGFLFFLGSMTYGWLQTFQAIGS